jgi:protease II
MPARLLQPKCHFRAQEWGNPNDKEYYDYMKKYSPVDNVGAKVRGHALVLGL